MGGKVSSVVYHTEITKPGKGETAIMRNADCSEKLKEVWDDQSTTLQPIWKNVVAKYGDRPLLGTMKANRSGYTWRTYKECYEISGNLAAGILARNLISETSDELHSLKCIGIFSKNREEWLLLEMGNILYNITMVPFYETLGKEATIQILEETELETLTCSSEGLANLLQTIDSSNKQKLKTIICLDKLEPSQAEKLKELEIATIEFKTLIEEGKKLKKPKHVPVTPDNIVTFSYTSGTTGRPKGALLSHRNFASIVVVARDYGFKESDVYLSFLPLPHILERVMVYALMSAGGSIGFYAGDKLKVADDIKVLNPTFFMSVPRVYNRMYQAIQDRIAALPSSKQDIFAKAVKNKEKAFMKNGTVKSSMWDKLVFNKVKIALGTRCVLGGCTAAPISPEILRWLKIALCIPIQEGYGTTETSGCTFFTKREDPEVGHVGGVQKHMEFKLVDVPELGYHSTDKDSKGNATPRGEIWVRGAGVFSGYYKNKELTDEVLEKDRWFKTGDIGMLLPQTKGLKIIDRKKNIFKLAQGEYVAPEKIENVYLKTRGIEEIFVSGDSLQSKLVAIVVPNREFLAKQAQIEVSDEGHKKLCADPKIVDQLLKSLIETGKSEGLSGFEQVAKIKLEPTPFDKNDLITPTLKVKRHEAAKFYAETIQELYSSMASTK